MTDQENAEVRHLISQGKSMKEIIKIMKDRHPNVDELFGNLFKKPKS